MKAIPIWVIGLIVEVGGVATLYMDHGVMWLIVGLVAPPIATVYFLYLFFTFVLPIWVYVAVVLSAISFFILPE